MRACLCVFRGYWGVWVMAKLIRAIALLGFIAAILAAVQLWLEWHDWRVMGTAVFYLPIAALATLMSWRGAKTHSIFAIFTAAFVWLNAALI